MTQHPYQTLELDGLKLLFTPCPGTQQQSLEDSLKTLKAAGAQVLITMMPSDEMVENEVTAIPELCKALDIQWFHFPVEDHCAPEAKCAAKWAQEKVLVVSAAKAQQTIAVHCKGGTGRTGLMIALIMAELGFNYDEIVARIQSVKEKSLTLKPHTDYLKQYLNQA